MDAANKVREFTLLPTYSVGIQRMTHVSHFWKVQQFPMPVLSVDDDTRVFMHERPSWQSLHEIELCAGFGGMTKGMLTSGFHAVAAVDQN